MPKTVVMGSANQDIVATTARYPSVGETVMGTSLKHLPGGKGANQAVAAALSGAESVFIGAVGSDSAGSELLAFIRAKGVDTSHVQQVEGPTGTAIITVEDGGENSIVVIPAANESVVDNPSVPLSKDVLLAQFEIPKSSVLDFFRRGRAYGCTNILNPSPMSEIDNDLLQLVDILVVNELELSLLLSSAPGSLQEAASQILPNGTVVVTLGANGLVTAGSLGSLDIPGHEVQAKDTTGAGDCFAGSLAGELSKGATFHEAVVYANKAAALCVTREGAAPSMFAYADVVSQ